MLLDCCYVSGGLIVKQATFHHWLTYNSIYFSMYLLLLDCQTFKPYMSFFAVQRSEMLCGVLCVLCVSCLVCFHPIMSDDSN